MTPVGARRTAAGADRAPGTRHGGVATRPVSTAVLHVDPDDPVRWAFGSRRDVRRSVVEHGAVLVRGLGLYDPVLAGDVVRVLADGLVPDREPLAPRGSYDDRIYGTTRRPPGLPVEAHHELSYCDRIPSMVLLVCLVPPTTGGATLLVDAHAVLRDLPPSLVRRCERDGWILVRNYDGDVGPSWPETFGTGRRAEVDDYCRAHAIETTWSPGGRLRTRQRRPAVVLHPVVGTRCWFNQIAYYSEWALGPDARAEVLDILGPDGLPVTTCFGDGTPIGWDLVAAVQRAYADNAVRLLHRSGDLLVVDNIRTAHGRDPYRGHRTMLVGMADPTDHRW